MKRVHPRLGRQVAFDVSAVAIALAIGAMQTLGSSPVFKAFGGLSTLLLAGIALALLWRRRAPLAVAWIVAGTGVAMPAIELVAPGTLLRSGETGVLDALLLWPPAAPFAAFSVMYRHTGRWACWPPVLVMGLAAVLVSPVVSIVPKGGEVAQSPDAVVFRSLVLIAGGTVLGMYAAARRRVLHGLVERAERLERERHLLAEQARADERSRLAAEMHDVVAHRVSLMVLQAGALRVINADPQVRTAAEELRVTGCQALEDLRDVIGLLRRTPAGEEEPVREEAEVIAEPDLAALVAESESVGTPVELSIEGSAPMASPVVGRTLHRVVQEALTNVRKHAPGARTAVRITYRANGVRVAVRNSAGGPPDAMLAATGSGTGLVGLRRRVELIGGTFEAGPDGDGGFGVEVTLPAYVSTDPQPTDRGRTGRRGKGRAPADHTADPAADPTDPADPADSAAGPAAGPRGGGD